ncbi:MAG: SCO family protein [Pseudomonadales bacterium]|jgi:protein SCO1/2|nr:SCO family protein [Pseudomonadales bacterium]
MPKKKYVSFLIAAGLIAAVAGAWLARELRAPVVPTLQSGTWLPSPRTLPTFQLLDERGAPAGKSALTGHPSLVFFGFTHCPDVCPTTLTLLTQAQQELGVANLKVVLVTVDPERDTPPQMARYLQAFHGDTLGLTGSPDELGRLRRQLGVAAARTDMPGGDYMIDHSATVFLLDAAGDNVAIFTPPFDRERLVADLRASLDYLGS